MPYDIPKTRQGLIEYINHCEHQIKVNLSANNRLEKEMRECEAALERMVNKEENGDETA